MSLIPTREEVQEVTLHAVRELCVSFIVGAIPLLLFAKTKEEFAPLLQASLTPEPFLMWYAWLMAPLTLSAILASRLNVRSGPSQRVLRNLYSLFSDVAGSMNTAVQLGLGAALGFMILWQVVEPETLSGTNFVVLCLLVIALLFFSTMLSLFLPVLRDPRRAKQKQKADQWLN